eukprot:scaffold125123_cov69-Phaeocystis_antarctica.AAC.4
MGDAMMEEMRNKKLGNKAPRPLAAVPQTVAAEEPAIPPWKAEMMRKRAAKAALEAGGAPPPEAAAQPPPMPAAAAHTARPPPPPGKPAVQE